jgi:hypothetical protein
MADGTLPQGRFGSLFEGTPAYDAARRRKQFTFGFLDDVGAHPPVTPWSALGCAFRATPPREACRTGSADGKRHPSRRAESLRPLSRAVSTWPGSPR